MKNFILITLIIFIVISCLPIDKEYYIKIENNSDSSVYFIESSTYPDTTLPQSNEYLTEIKSHNFERFGSTEPWDEEFSNRYPKDTMILFFISSNVIKNISWDIIRINYDILERRIFSKQDLEKTDWTITYP
jgi:hypothetical protein